MVDSTLFNFQLSVCLEVHVVFNSKDYVDSAWIVLGERYSHGVGLSVTQICSQLAKPIFTSLSQPTDILLNLSAVILKLKVTAVQVSKCSSILFYKTNPRVGEKRHS